MIRGSVLRVLSQGELYGGAVRSRFHSFSLIGRVIATGDSVSITSDRQELSGVNVNSASVSNITQQTTVSSKVVPTVRSFSSPSDGGRGRGGRGGQHNRNGGGGGRGRGRGGRGRGGGNPNNRDRNPRGPPNPQGGFGARADFDGAPGSGGDGGVEDPNKPKNQQEFVKVRFEPGEWDDTHSDPMYLPPFDANDTNKRVISEEDILNRPSAGFSEEFASMADARFAPSWMNCDQKDQIYKDYIMLLETMAEKEEGGVTSHEYVMHVLARKYSIKPDRVAAIVHLGHEEEQIKKSEDAHKIYFPDLGPRVDRAMNDMLDRMYAQYREQRPDPHKFLEPVIERQSRTYDVAEVNDLFDVDELEKQAILSDRERAQRIIDTKIYIEDEDPATVDLKINRDCEELIERHGKLRPIVKSPLEILGEHAPFPALKEKEEQEEEEDTEEGAAAKEKPPPPPLQRRKEWKWVCHTTNTHDQKKLKNPRTKADLKKRLATSAQNTIVNYEGKLRPATEEELYQVAWKPKKNEKEVLYRSAKEGWIARKHRGQPDAWGPAKNYVPLSPEDRKKMLQAGGGGDIESVSEETSPAP